MRAVWVPDGEDIMRPEDLRAEFLRLLTEDSDTTDARRRDFNQALFFSPDEPRIGGRPVWNFIDLDMVLAKYDKAVKNLKVRLVHEALEARNSA